MPARTPALDVDAEDPEVWPVTGVDARKVDVHVKDSELDLFVTFEFGLLPGHPLRVLSYRVTSIHGIEVPLRDLPILRWEKAAQAAAERRLVAGGPYGQQADRAAVAQMIVDEKFPELVGASKGNALRRRKALLQLAEQVSEYMEAKESGSSNPAQVLADRYGVSAATVRGWLHRARREGLALESAHPNASPRPQG
ncbi:helix-turn-helix domain-containing protein [Streptomyces sp. NPDC001221]